MKKPKVEIKNKSTKEGKSVNRRYSKEDVDYFAIYNVESDILLFPNAEVNKSSITFHINSTKNNQTKNVNFVWNYYFETIINQYAEGF